MMKITFEAAELPEGHPEKYNDRSDVVAKRWWKTTLELDDGTVITGTARWHLDQIHAEIRELQRPERPSERVMRELSIKKTGVCTVCGRNDVAVTDGMLEPHSFQDNRCAGAYTKPEKVSP